MIKIKFKIGAFIALFSFSSLFSCNKKNNLTNEIINDFIEIAKHPRPSEHEKGISDYIVEYSKKLGLNPIQNPELYYIVVDVPATKGFEDKEPIIIQSHMDTVFNTAKGYEDLKPEETPINVVNDGTYLKSDGRTNLGADDGIGMSICLQVMKNKIDHGPVRVMFTVNEEQGCIGASYMDQKYFDGYKYLINLDWFTEGTMCLSSAGGKMYAADKKYNVETKDSAYDTCLKLDLSGLCGGHSGVNITDNRLNGLLGLGYILKSLDIKLDFKLQSFVSGKDKDNNAIPAEASCVIFVKNVDKNKAIDYINFRSNFLKDLYKNTEPDYNFQVSEFTNEDQKVLTKDSKLNFLNLLSTFQNGVYKWSKDIDNFPISSNNLGVANLDSEGNATLGGMYRTSDLDDMTIIQDKMKEYFENEYSYTFEPAPTSVDVWPFSNDNLLAKKSKEIYKDLFKTDIQSVAVHAGLECATFYRFNNKLNIIATGPTVAEEHSINERVEIATIGKFMTFFSELLKNI